MFFVTLTGKVSKLKKNEFYLKLPAVSDTGLREIRCYDWRDLEGLEAGKQITVTGNLEFVKDEGLTVKLTSYNATEGEAISSVAFSGTLSFPASAKKTKNGKDMTMLKSRAFGGMYGGPFATVMVFGASNSRARKIQPNSSFDAYGQLSMQLYKDKPQLTIFASNLEQTAVTIKDTGNTKIAYEEEF